MKCPTLSSCFAPRRKAMAAFPNNTSMNKIFEADGRPAKSVSPVITVLIRRKLIKRVGNGEYVLLAKAKPAPKKAAPKPVVNGSALHIEDASHG